jgi:hypothetical protein
VKKLLIILFVALPALAMAQSSTISAKVVDDETSEPLGFASVTIKGVPIGTISNEEGEFDFHFPRQYELDILVVSMLGYTNFEVPVWTMLGDTLTVIRLVKSPIELQEVVVSDTLSGGDILRIALSRIEDNYPMHPFLMDGFYRDVKKVGGTHISLLEAAVQIFDENYEAPRNIFKLRERVRLVEVRQSLGYESKFTKYFDQANLLEDLLLHNTIRYRHIEEEDELFAATKREKNSFFDGHEIYVVTYDNEAHLNVYINKTNFAVVHLDFDEGPSAEGMQKKKNLISRRGGLKKSMDFRMYNGKMYLSFLTMTSKVNWYDIETNELKFETELFQQLLINKVVANPKERIGSTERMRNYGLQYQDHPYNKKFWDNYNVIKETPLDAKILSDLEKLSPLQVQFEEN